MNIIHENISPIYESRNLLFMIPVLVMKNGKWGHEVNKQDRES